MSYESAHLAIVPGPALLFGLMLLAAIVGGYAARSFHLPRVVGYLIGGAVLRAIVYKVFDAGAGSEAAAALARAADPLTSIRDLALGMILFMIGGVFERSRFRASAQHLRTISVIEIAATFAFVTCACLLVGLVVGPRGPGLWALALLMGTASIATAPAATLSVLQEYEAKGPITDTVLGLTAVNNIVCIVLFYSTFVLLVSLGAIETTGVQTRHPALVLACTTVGSVVLGVFCGLLISVLHARLLLPEMLLVFFAVFILLGAGEKWLLEHVGLSFNFLLTTLVIGAVFANVGRDWSTLLTALRTVGTPILAGFFVMAGYSLHLGDLTHMGWIGGAYVIARAAGKVLGCRAGVAKSGGPPRAERRLGSALFCQAAVVIGLASFVERNWSGELARTFSTVMLGSVVVFELIGPVLLKRCVVQAGEVKAISLMRRGGAAAAAAPSIGFTLRSFARTVLGKRRLDGRLGEAFRVEDVMRTNVQFIPASATLDEVLGYMERSTYDHFPVVLEKGELVGVIHFGDVREVIYDPMMHDLITAYDLADADTPIVSTGTPLDELLAVFEKCEIGVLPVTDDPQHRHVIGIVDQRDVLRAIHHEQQLT